MHFSITVINPPGGGGTPYNGLYLPGGSARKGYLFQASGI